MGTILGHGGTVWARAGQRTLGVAFPIGGSGVDADGVGELPRPARPVGYALGTGGSVRCDGRPEGVPGPVRVAPGAVSGDGSGTDGDGTGVLVPGEGAAGLGGGGGGGG
ncbi:hypothetical protein AOB60_40110, partial [Streptomyces noursei]